MELITPDEEYRDTLHMLQPVDKPKGGNLRNKYLTVVVVGGGGGGVVVVVAVVVVVVVVVSSGSTALVVHVYCSSSNGGINCINSIADFKLN